MNFRPRPVTKPDMSRIPTCVFVALFVAYAAGPSAQGPAAPSPHVTAARAIAQYLRSIARDESVPGAATRGLSWPVSDITAARQTGMDSGAAGIGTFFLDLYLATRNVDDLLTAERASTWVFSEYRRRGPNGRRRCPWWP